jgi:hypothetical protein
MRHRVRASLRQGGARVGSVRRMALAVVCGLALLPVSTAAPAAGPPALSPDASPTSAGESPLHPDSFGSPSPKPASTRTPAARSSAPAAGAPTSPTLTTPAVTITTTTTTEAPIARLPAAEAAATPTPGPQQEIATPPPATPTPPPSGLSSAPLRPTLPARPSSSSRPLNLPRFYATFLVSGLASNNVSVPDITAADVRRPVLMPVIAVRRTGGRLLVPAALALLALVVASGSFLRFAYRVQRAS